ncbi:unnamed protein product [Phytophthora fragariaefolia]|uniref:Unnamed protein product n=1 Tax=Phytophthora fragariaefolia TaxID=1490495 RepID=A0A9W6YNY0_9STRA|nr:unnamed protein product [Phytophthora fragariaefolia]
MLEEYSVIDDCGYCIDAETASKLQDRQEWIDSLRRACRTRQNDVLLAHAQSSRRGQNAKAMAELLSAPLSPGYMSTPRTDLRASFQLLHEMVLLKKLVDTIKTSWGPPSQWSMTQYQQLVQGISLAQENTGSSEIESGSILAEAFDLRYRFEEIPDNQRKLSQEDDPLGAARSPNAKKLQQSELASPVASPRVSPEIRCPSFHSYYATFEELSERVGDTVKALSSDKQYDKVLTPRSATMAKYAHLYLLDDIRAKQPWGLGRIDDDDLTDKWKEGSSLAMSEAELVDILAGRFEKDRIYTYVNHHTMIVMNPYRLLQTARFTSIYDEQVVLTYADTTSAETSLAPHPFSIAKQSLVRLFFGRERFVGNLSIESTVASKRVVIPCCSQSVFLCGESGSGKTELAKDLLKYLVLVAKPALSCNLNDSVINANRSLRHPKIKLFTSSTKSTIQMRTEETRTIALLEAKGVDNYEIVLLDLHPKRWDEMTSVSRSKRLPQVHVDGQFFGFYDKLERLEDEEQLRIYLKNPRAAKKLSTVLDSNIILEAFGHATTSMNLNSSRFGKVTTLQISFGVHPWEFQICGCCISPFLLEKSRVTSGKNPTRDQTDMNFHILYAMVAGVNAFPFMRLLANDLHLDGVTCSVFTYLGLCDHKLAEFMSKEDTWKKDVERWQQVLDGMNELQVSPDQQKTVFKVLSAVLWLGNIELDYSVASEKLAMSSIGVSNAPERVVDLLELESVELLKRMLTTKSVILHSTNETFEVILERGQVIHVRDTLARLLYQLAFDYIVNAMNEATKPDEISEDDTKGRATHDSSFLKIIDVFGFEDLTRNSLDQLCINYLSEKLYAREEQVLLAAYRIDGVPTAARVLDKPNDAIFIYEHPFGVFASLEELTILHQNENYTAQHEEKRNVLFVHNLYDRNPSRLPKPPRVLRSGKRQSSVSVTALPFVIPHTRGNVIYDASDFIKKNSDFVYATLLEGLKTSSNVHLRQMLNVNYENGASNKNSNSVEVRSPPSKSFVGQFRSHVNVLTNEDDANMPFYFHCIRPNAKKQPSVVAKDFVLQQCRSQRLFQHVQICSDSTSVYSAIEVSKNIVLVRYRCLLRPPYTRDKVVNSDEALLKWLNNLLGSGSVTVKLSTTTLSSVQFSSLGLVEQLELLLEDREAEAATRIQSLFIMVMWRHRYLAKKRERRGLWSELLAWYGSEKKDTVKKLLVKYNGREDELRAKLELQKRSKLQEERAVHQLASDLRSLCLSSHGGLDAQVVNDILHDDAMREILQQNEKIVSALRDMSLSPDTLQAQLVDNELREFYQKLVNFLRSKNDNTSQGSSGNFTTNSISADSLNDRVAAAASKENHNIWMRLVNKQEWSVYRDALMEIGEDPELLLFHSEDTGFVETLEQFLVAVALEKQWEAEQKSLASITSLVQPSTVDGEGVISLENFTVPDDEDAKVLELLLSVHFGPSLMMAMNQDFYFVQALQDPVLMTSMHQV